MINRKSLTKLALSALFASSLVGVGGLTAFADSSTTSGSGNTTSTGSGNTTTSTGTGNSTTTSTGAGTSTTTTSASTTQASIDVLANQIVTVSQELKTNASIGTTAKPILTILQGSSLDWDQVMFGTDSLSASQTKTAVALEASIPALTNFTISDHAKAVVAIQNVMVQMESLNPSITDAQVVSFLHSLEVSLAQQVLSTLVPLGSKVQPSDVANAFHTALQAADASDAKIQALFSVTGKVTTLPGPTGTGKSGGTTGSSGNNGDTGSASSGKSGPTTNPQPTQAPPAIQQAEKAFQYVLAKGVTGAGGGFIAKKHGVLYFKVAIPKAAFAGRTQVSVTAAKLKDINKAITTDLNKLLPHGFVTEGAIRVDISANKAAKPLVLTVKRSGIAANARVYELTDKGLRRVKSIVKKGTVEVSVKTSTQIIIVDPKN